MPLPTHPQTLTFCPSFQIKCFNLGLDELFQVEGKNDRQKLEFLCLFPKTSMSHFFKVLKRLTRKLKTFGLFMTFHFFL